MPIDPEDIEEEHRHLATVIATFQQYGPYSVKILHRDDVVFTNLYCA